MSNYTKGRSRPTRQAAAQHRYADMKLESNGYYIEDQPIANGGSNEPTVRVDLAKLKVQALRKYTKVYEVAGVHPQSTKEEIANAVQRHWNTMNISEESVLQSVLRFRSRTY